MRSANSITLKRGILFSIFSFLFIVSSTAQENSPYSRYGLGDIIPNSNIVNRGMGGISTGTSSFQSLNLKNPAALSAAATTIFDFGGEIDIRSLKSNTTAEKFRATNTIISYLQLGFPITPKKMREKGNAWAVSFGLRPVTRINYKIATARRISGIDSLETLYEGDGGLSQANISTGVRIKNFSFGIGGGYSFGNKKFTTRLNFLNDSIPFARSTTESSVKYGGVFVNAGLQYRFQFVKKKDPKKKDELIIGASANFKQDLDARRDDINATFAFNQNGEVINVDTVTVSSNERGTVRVPGTYSAGFSYNTPNWTVGADVDYAQWSKYRSYGAADPLQNNIVFRAGVQYFPADDRTTATKYFRFVKYRAGLYYGKDYVKLDNNSSRPEYALTLGAGFPLTSLTQRNIYGDFVTLNAGLELGQRGNKSNQSLRENYGRILIGISVDTRWFVKRAYD